jgi:hypothetical protein
MVLLPEERPEGFQRVHIEQIISDISSTLMLRNFVPAGASAANSASQVL